MSPDAGETQPPVETRSASPSSATATAENPPAGGLPRSSSKLALMRWDNELLSLAKRPRRPADPLDSIARTGRGDEELAALCLVWPAEHGCGNKLLTAFGMREVEALGERH
jgi:hypothetical protein